MSTPKSSGRPASRAAFFCGEFCSDWAAPSQVQSVFRHLHGQPLAESTTEKVLDESIRRFMNGPG